MEYLEVEKKELLEQVENVYGIRPTVILDMAIEKKVLELMTLLVDMQTIDGKLRGSNKQLYDAAIENLLTIAHDVYFLLQSRVTALN